MKPAFRLFGLLLLVGATFYLPKIVSEGGVSRRMEHLLRTGDGSEAETQTAAFGAGEPPLTLASANSRTGDGGNTMGRAPAEKIEIVAPRIERQLLPFDQFLRFDITPEWVIQRFDRVTILPTQGGEGMRVALITGTRRNDVVGSLTYFFNHQHVVQRITVDGVTADPTELIQFVTRQHKLKQVGRDAYARQHHGIVSGGMLVRRSSVISRTAPQESEVILEINRPDKSLPISPPFHQRLYRASNPS